MLVDAQVGGTRSTLGGTSQYTDGGILAMGAFHTENWAGHLYGEYSHSQGQQAPSQLGGFLRLSGTPADSVSGRSIAFGRLVMARRIGALPVTLGGTVRAGFSIEAGGGFDPRAELKTQGTPFKQAVSGFFSVDTRFGPAYLGAGATKDGDRTLYIYLGPIW
jgi:NTE family protein